MASHLYLSLSLLLFQVMLDIEALPPVMTSSDSYNLNEESSLSTRLLGFDFDGDAIEFQVDTAAPTPRGKVKLMAGGFLEYIPCKDCYGTDVAYFVIVETAKKPPENAFVNVTFVIRPLNDAPHIVIVDDIGESFRLAASGSRDLLMQVEERKLGPDYPFPRYHAIRFAVLGTDVDGFDKLSVISTEPKNGTLRKSIQFRSISFTDQNCTLPFHNRSMETIKNWEEFLINFKLNNESSIPTPCNISLPRIDWRPATVFVAYEYSPDIGFYGNDSSIMHIYDGSKKSLTSDSMEIHLTFAVNENLCLHNSTCVGNGSDVSCNSTQRTHGYNSSGYFCDCLPGFRGKLCEVNIDECLLPATSCPWNYTCVDEIDGYACVCKKHWPCFYLLPLTVTLGTSVGIFVLLILVPCLFIRRLRKRIAVNRENEDEQLQVLDEINSESRDSIVSTGYKKPREIRSPSKISFNVWVERKDSRTWVP